MIVRDQLTVTTAHIADIGTRPRAKRVVRDDGIEPSTYPLPVLGFAQARLDRVPWLPWVNEWCRQRTGSAGPADAP
jgi:hypothetical protein